MISTRLTTLLAAAIMTAVVQLTALPLHTPNRDDGTVAIDAAASDGRATGTLPAGWIENSAWARATVTYRVATEDGAPFLRADIAGIESGYCQFMYPAELPDRAACYRLSFQVRMRGRAKMIAGIRLVEKPFTWKYKNSFIPDGTWRTCTWEFALPRPGTARTAILFQIDGPGRLDLRDVRLETIPAAAAAATGPDAANWLRHSAFPLGLPAGWSLHNCFSEGDMVRVEPDPAVVGPSGAPALLLDVPAGTMTSYDYRDRMEVNSPPIPVPAAAADAVASLSLRGSGEGSWAVFRDGRRLAEVPFHLDRTQNWQRLELKFKTGPGRYTVGLKVKGRIWIDDLRVAAAGAPANRPPEVALTLASGDAALAGISFADEPLNLKFVVLHPVQGGTLRLKTVNLYGDEQTYRLPLTSGPLPFSGDLTLRLTTGRELGPLRVEAWTADAAGKRTSPYAETLINRLPRPRYWGKDAPDSAFGIHVQPSNRQLVMAKAIGANWARLHDAGVQLLGWAYLERKPGEWTFDDAGVDRYRRHHLKLLGELTTAPTWASYATRSSAEPPALTNSVTAPYFLPLEMSRYEEYCRKLIARYRDRIDHFDVWNEPWLPLFFHTDFVKTFPAGKKRWASFGGGWYVSPDDPAATFINMQQTVFNAAKTVNPDFKVLGFNTTDSLGTEGRVPGGEFTGRMEELGAVHACDIICYHQYLRKITGYPGDEVDAGYRRAFAPLLKKYGDRLPHPVWLSEGSPLSDPTDAFYRHTVPGGQPAELFDYGDRVVRFVVSLLAHRVEKVFLYSMGLHRGYGVINPHRLLTTPAGELHSAAGAYAAMTAMLENKHFVRVIPVGRRVYAYLFAGSGEAAAVLLPDPRTADFALTLPAAPGFRALDLFGNPLAAGTPVPPYACYLTGRGSADDLNRILISNNQEK